MRESKRSVDALIEAAGAVRTRLFPLDASQVTAVELDRGRARSGEETDRPVDRETAPSGARGDGP